MQPASGRETPAGLGLICHLIDRPAFKKQDKQQNFSVKGLLVADRFRTLIQVSVTLYQEKKDL